MSQLFNDMHPFRRLKSVLDGFFKAKRVRKDRLGASWREHSCGRVCLQISNLHLFTYIYSYTFLLNLFTSQIVSLQDYKLSITQPVNFTLSFLITLDVWPRLGTTKKDFGGIFIHDNFRDSFVVRIAFTIVLIVFYYPADVLFFPRVLIGVAMWISIIKIFGSSKLQKDFLSKFLS